MLKPFSGEKNSKSLRKKPPFLGPISAALAWCLEHPAVMSEYTTVVHGVLATYYVVTGITAVLKTYNKSIPQ